MMTTKTEAVDTVYGDGGHYVEIHQGRTDSQLEIAPTVSIRHVANGPHVQH